MILDLAKSRDLPHLGRILDLLHQLESEFAKTRFFEPSLAMRDRLRLMNVGQGSAADGEEERICELGRRFGFAPHPFRSESMLRLLEDCVLAAASSRPVLLRGEPGVGKEALARQLHLAGPRSGEPFFVVPCSAVSDSLLESELFGHVKDAFTGAVH